MQTYKSLAPDTGGRSAQDVATAPASPLQHMADESARTARLREQAAVVQRAPRRNHTGLPDQLKAGIEALSGIGMDHVRVHYGSSKPALLQAHAYAQGSEIHLGAGQERHLPHEAWHLVQQAQGRVGQTMRTADGTAVNTEETLEREADRMGAAAQAVGSTETSPGNAGRPPIAPAQLRTVAGSPVQKKLLDGKGNDMDEGSIGELVALFGYRHGPAEVGVFEDLLRRRHRNGKAIRIDDLASELFNEDLADLKRLGHLLRLILHEFHSYAAGEAVGVEAWDDFSQAVEMLRGWAAVDGRLNQPEVGEALIPQKPGRFVVPGEDLAKVRRIRPAQWQAAAVAARRAGWLSGVGFLELRRALDRDTGGAIKLELSRDVVHEGLETDSERGTDKIYRGTLAAPQYNPAGEAIMKAAALIRGWAADNSRLNEPGEDEELAPLIPKQPARFDLPERRLADVLRIEPAQWQAAAVIARKSGWLTGMGFLELRRALDKGTRGAIRLEFSREILEEGVATHEERGLNQVSTEVMSAHHVDAETLSSKLSIFNSASLFRSGRYTEEQRVILKGLDIGHKVVDSWENYTHRTEGKHVDDKTRFNFLALLSPRPGSQQAVGANGQTLGDGSYMFTIDPAFRFRYMPAANYVGEGGTAKNFFQYIPHSQLASLGAVAAAGNFVISGGRFKWVDNGSGHYRVDPAVNTANAKATLVNLGYDIQPVAFLSRGDGDLDQTYKEGNAFLKGLPGGAARPEMTMEIRKMQEAMKRMG